MALSKAAAHHRAKIGALSRSRPDDDVDLIEAKRGFKEAQAADYIERVLSTAPPLTDEQRMRLAELFRPSTATKPSGVA
ncbi:hypothetical protein [Mycobacterium sp. IDR2000157661]|uniref:hypothetical protein n=1 Tax=Mycobacterium sp. IDR2000157661 TaxID=2867005 RepID=UPI001EEC7FD8|nr:hypothetical protein [Mycobacterium sp. IDR2000157661]ULE32589.1 hypothetical protein K3G64_21230 [Mycobacterium sp. IDR2000157661]